MKYEETMSDLQRIFAKYVKRIRGTRPCSHLSTQPLPSPHRENAFVIHPSINTLRSHVFLVEGRVNLTNIMNST